MAVFLFRTDRGLTITRNVYENKSSKAHLIVVFISFDIVGFIRMNYVKDSKEKKMSSEMMIEW